MTKKILFYFTILLGLHTLVKAQDAHLIEIGSRDSLFSNVLQEQRLFWIQLPENFSEEREQSYPVIYVLDGAVHLQAVHAVLNYYWGGYMPEMIIVGISNGSHRTRDLTTSEVETRRGAAYSQESGGAVNFTRFLEEELIPYVEASYPVSSYRTIIGHSYAGLFTIHLLMNHSDLFDNYIAIDPSLDWDNQKLLKQSLELFRKSDYHGKSLFMTLSGQLHLQNNDITIENVMQDSSDYTLFARSIITYANAVKENDRCGLNFQWKFYEKDIHGTVPLPSIMDGLKFLFEWFPIENTDMFNSPETALDDLINLIRSRENKLKDHFGYFVPPFDEELLLMLGYMNLEWGNTQTSLALFQLALEYYPDSAEALENIKELEKTNQ